MVRSYISPEAKIGSGVLIKKGATIDHGTRIGNYVKIGAFATIGVDSSIGHGSIIERGVLIGSKVAIGELALLMENAQVCPNSVHTNSSDARTLQRHVSVGPNVLLHDEVELGPYAIIPSQRTIAHIGSLGSKNRVVTIYGSDEGPRYSIGCQIGESLDVIKDHINKHLHTSDDSAATYRPFIGIFDEIGTAVQTAYDKAAPLVAEIKDMRLEAGMPMQGEY